MGVTQGSHGVAHRREGAVGQSRFIFSDQCSTTELPCHEILTAYIYRADFDSALSNGVFPPLPLQFYCNRFAAFEATDGPVNPVHRAFQILHR